MKIPSIVIDTAQNIATKNIICSYSLRRPKAGKRPIGAFPGLSNPRPLDILRHYIIYIFKPMSNKKL